MGHKIACPVWREELRKNCDAAHQKIIDAVRSAARDLGYCIAVHGSLARDLDYLAAPWTEDAAPAEELVNAVEKVAHDILGWAHIDPSTNPGRKPQGRKAWTILLAGGPFIDLSVMPRACDIVKGL